MKRAVFLVAAMWSVTHAYNRLETAITVGTTWKGLAWTIACVVIAGFYTHWALNDK